MAQQAVQDALLQHDRVRRSTELPLFYGVAGKDTLSARNLIERAEAAGWIANWPDDARRCEEFWLILRDKALVWWRSLKDDKIDNKDWNAVKTAFLRTFEPKYTARTTCANLAELSQRGPENALDYYFRLFETFEKLMESKPDLGVVQHVPQNPIVANDLVEAKKEGAAILEEYIKHQMYIAGLKDPLRTKAMEAGKANIAQTRDFAMETERIHQRGQENLRLNPIQEAKAGPREDLEDLDEEDIEAINAVRFRQGKPPFRRSGFSSSTSNNNRRPSATNIKCRYCKKIGHMQKECRSRIRDGAPMVDPEGKPYARKVQGIDNQTPGNLSQRTNRTPETSSISTIDLQETSSLNW